MKYCKECGAELNENSKFCKECSTQVNPTKLRYCKECGSKLNETSKFCLECGASVNADTSSYIQDLPIQASNEILYPEEFPVEDIAENNDEIDGNYATKKEIKKDTNVAKAVVIIAVVVALILIIGTILLISLKNKSKQVNDAGQTSAIWKEPTPQTSASTTEGTSTSDSEYASAEDYIGITLSELWKMSGENYSTINYNGGKFLTYDDTVYSFGAFDASDNTEFTGYEQLNCILVSKDGYVTDGIYVGMNFDEIQKAYGSSLEEYITTDDEYGGLYLNFPYKNNYEITFTWSGDDRTEPSNFGMIKTTNNDESQKQEITTAVTTTVTPKTTTAKITPVPAVTSAAPVTSQPITTTTAEIAIKSIVTDPSKVIGNWIAYDYTNMIEDINTYNPLLQKHTQNFFINSLAVTNDGKCTLTNTNQSSSLSWKNGVVYNLNNEEFSKYTIVNINNIDFMYFEWKGGDYEKGGKLGYYIFVREGQKVYVDEKALGKWIYYDFIDNKNDFNPDKIYVKNEVYLNYLIFNDDGTCILNLGKKSLGQQSDFNKTWKKGSVNTEDKESCYEIRTYKGVDYMIFENITGDYTRDGTITYWVLKRAS